MRIQFVGNMGELLATLKALLGRFPAISAMDVTQRMLEQARLELRRN